MNKNHFQPISTRASIIATKSMALFICVAPLLLSLFTYYEETSYHLYITIEITSAFALLLLSGDYKAYRLTGSAFESKDYFMLFPIPFSIIITILTFKILAVAPNPMPTNFVLFIPLLTLCVLTLLFAIVILCVNTQSKYQGIKYFTFSSGTISLMYLHQIVCAWNLSDINGKNPLYIIYDICSFILTSLALCSVWIFVTHIYKKRRRGAVSGNKRC